MKHILERITTETLSNGCIYCTSHKPHKRGDGRVGYYRVCINGIKKYLHRVIFEYLYGEIPAGKMLMHSCDDQLCINDEHLSLGTHKENTRQAIERNRYKRGKK